MESLTVMRRVTSGPAWTMSAVTIEPATATTRGPVAEPEMRL